MIARKEISRKVAKNFTQRRKGAIELLHLK